MKRLLAAVGVACALLLFVLPDTWRSLAQAPAPTPLPTCPPTTCPQPRLPGEQPLRSQMQSAFRQAAVNRLGAAGPPYDAINLGLPPAMVSRPIGSGLPLPLTVLQAVAWQESRWIQFGDTVGAPTGVLACTFLTPDCGYGVMQITSCMSDGCGWFDPLRVAAEITYNIGTGANFLIRKWNHAPFLGDNIPSRAEEWYYAVLAYNGWSTCNDPNRTLAAPGCPTSQPFLPDRPPYLEGDYRAYRYPYQEMVWGWMARPAGDLWRSTRLPPVPRGLFGLRRPDSWQPPSQTPLPQSTLLPSLWVSGTQGSILRLQNTTPVTLAADILLYNQDDTFNRRWLGAPPNGSHLYPMTGLRLPPGRVITVPLSEAFYPWETFQGYARVESVQGVLVSTAGTVHLPLVMQSGSAPCTPVLQNGGFEQRTLSGQPAAWEAFSAGGYALADATRLFAGHLSAHLGGYNAARDALTQTFQTLSNTQSAHLSLWWRVDSHETITSTDRLTISLHWATITQTLAILTPTLASWQRLEAHLPLSANVTATLHLQAVNDEMAPTDFYLDDLTLWLCETAPEGP